jgi:hypothetical protein
VERFSILTDENTAKGIAKALIDRGWDVVRGVRTLAQGRTTTCFSSRRWSSTASS